MIRIAVVVQRYGRDIVGGAETLARDVAERLNASECDVTVYTTTARDYITWENEYEPGETILRGVIIRRFRVDRTRDIDAFNRISSEFFREDMKDRRDLSEDEWIDLQGPFAPDLIRAVEADQDNFDVFVFFTYLYYTTVKAMRVIRKPCLLFPTAHEEPPINMEIMKAVFNRPESLLFLTHAEMEMVARKFSTKGKQVLVRTGVNVDGMADGNRFRMRYRVILPFMLYAGRIERGKGLELVFDAFREIRRDNAVDLVLMGKKLMDIPDIEGIKYVGFVPEADKLSAFRGAVCSIQPSSLESLSITTLESFAQETPVLVNSRCAVLMEHVANSGGGLGFDGKEELIDGFNTLFRNKNTRNAMGKKGYEYVRTCYSWQVVMDKITAEISELLK